MEPNPGSGIRVSPQGDFTWTTVLSTGTGGCRLYAAEYLKGTVVVEGEKITFYPTVRRKKYHSACQPDNRFDRDESTSSFSLNYTLSEEVNEAGQRFNVFTLINPDQSERYFYQQKA